MTTSSQERIKLFWTLLERLRAAPEALGEEMAPGAAGGHPGETAQVECVSSWSGVQPSGCVPGLKASMSMLWGVACFAITHYTKVRFYVAF